MVQANAIIAEYGSKCKIKKNRWTLEWRWRPSTKGHKVLVGMFRDEDAARAYGEGCCIGFLNYG